MKNKNVKKIYKQQKRTSDLTEKFLIRKYSLEDLSAEKIAKMTGHGKPTILKYLNKYGIRRKKMWGR